MKNKSFGRIRTYYLLGVATQWFTLLGNFKKKYKGRCNYFKTSLETQLPISQKKLMDVLKTLKINIKIIKTLIIIYL